MERLPRRLHITLMATILFSIFALEPTPSSTAVPASPQRASPLTSLSPLTPQMTALREPAAPAWPAPPITPLVTPQDLRAAVERKPRRFDLFDEELGADARRRRLAELPFGSIMAQVSERHGVDGLLVAAIVESESGFNPAAVSPRGAVGLMQVMPPVGRVYGAKNLKDPRANLDAGSRYLRSLLEDYDGDLRLTLAAYNAGPAKVARYRGMPPYRETRTYVQRVLRLYRTHGDRAAAASLAAGSAEPKAPELAGFSIWQKGPGKSTDRLALRGMELPGLAGS